MNEIFYWCDSLFINRVCAMAAFSLIFGSVFCFRKAASRYWIWIYIIGANLLLASSLCTALACASRQCLITGCIRESLRYESFSPKELGEILDEYSNDTSYGPVQSQLRLLLRLMTLQQDLSQQDQAQKDQTAQSMDTPSF